MARKSSASLSNITNLVGDAGALTITEPTKVNREEWLETAIRNLRPMFEAQGLTLPEVRVSCGFPKGNVKKVIGQAWSTAASEDGVSQIFVSPFVSDSLRVLDILVHELIHAEDNNENGHKAAFTKKARAMGLEGKPTATVAGEALTASLTAIVESIGAYPHGSLLDNQAQKPQTTRMLKLECPKDGYIVRTTAKWLQVGMPTCPCGTEMVCDALKDEDGDEG